MSGYDFLSGFLGSLGDQMKDKEARKRALEDEARADRRALSREEAIAASRERQDIRNEERQLRNAEPKMVETIVNGERRTGLARWNPSVSSDVGPRQPGYDYVGETMAVAPSFVREVKSDGRVKHLYSDGTVRDMGESEGMAKERGQAARNANSISAQRALQEARIQADREIAGLKPATMPAGFAATVRDMYSPYADKGERGKATMAAGAGLDPKLTAAERDAAMMEIAKTQAINLLTPKAPGVMFRGSPAATANEAQKAASPSPEQAKLTAEAEAKIAAYVKKNNLTKEQEAALRDKLKAHQASQQ